MGQVASHKADLGRFEAELKQARREQEEERISSEKIRGDLNLAQTHVEQLESENSQLNEDVERLQKIAPGLEALNKQFSDLEHQQEQEKQNLRAQKEKEIGEIADIITEKQATIDQLND